MPKDSIYLNFVPFIESRVPADSQLIYKRGTGPTSHLTPSTLRVPLWRREVSNSQFHRNLRLALAAAAVLTVAGCSKKPPTKTATAAKKLPQQNPPAVPKAAR